MNTINEFRTEQLYTNDQIRFSLNVENLGGIRPSVDSKKNLRHIAILTAAQESSKLISENPYHDRIEGNILLYTAQGREGDQIIFGRNKRLLEQYTIPAPFYGFANVGKQTYRFLGLLELLRHYQEVQADRRGNLRKVWLFEFYIHKEPNIVPIEQAWIINAGLLSESRRQNPLSELEREVTGLNADEQIQEDVTNRSEIEYLRSLLYQIKPYKFEHLIKAVMELNGFTQVSVTTVSGDGGIDINAYVDISNDFFAGTHVQAQVKRWRHAIGSVEINNFRGALNVTAKGVFITTSQYTRAAVIEARHQTKPSITLIDGAKLSSIIIKNNFSVREFLNGG